MATVGYMVRSAKRPTFRRLGMVFYADRDTFVPDNKLTDIQRAFLLASNAKRELIVMPTDGPTSSKGTVEGVDTAQPLSHPTPTVPAPHEPDERRRKR